MRIGSINIPILLLVAFVAISCSNDDLPPGEEASIPIVYNTRTYTHEARSAQTRAASDLTEYYDNFYVRSFKNMADDSRQEVMPRYTVEYEGGKWHYDGLTSLEDGQQYLKFWDLSAKKYTFAAVSPVPDQSETAKYEWKDTNVSISENGDIDITGIKGNVSSIGDKSGNSTKAPDWMVARTVRTFADDRDVDDIVYTKSPADPDAILASPLAAPFADVPLMFHHIFARVDFVAYATMPILVSRFKVYISDDTPDDYIINQGNYTTRTDDGGNYIGWKDKKAATKDDTDEQQDPKRFADYPYQPARMLGIDAETPVMLASHVQIPQEWAESGRELKITIETTDKDANGNAITYNGIIVLDQTNNGTNSWLENHHYTYVLKIDTGAGDRPVILFEVDLDTWKWILGNTTDDEEHDW